MSSTTATYVSDYITAGCALLALFLILPAAAAAAYRLHPGWRAWVWPLAFVSLAVSSLGSAFSGHANLAVDSWVSKSVTLVTGLALTLFVLNALYRVMVRTNAVRLAVIVWLAWGCFGCAVVLTNFSFVLVIYQGLCAIGLYVLYGVVYVREQERAADAPPIFIGTTLVVVAAFINAFRFEFDLGLVVFNQVVFYHLLQAVAVFFFLKAGFHFYNIKYAEQRRQERELVPSPK